MHKQIILLLSIISLTACGPTPMGYTVSEFDNAVEKLYGKSPEEVAQVIGKPAQFDKSTLNGGESFECFGYEGVKDVATGKLSRGTTICFKGGKLQAQKPSYSF
jgi:hypothetical protein